MKPLFLLLTFALLSACDMRGDTPKDGVGEGGETQFSAKQFPRENGRIYGGWEGPETSAGSGVRFRLFFNRSGQIAMEMVCESEKGFMRSSDLGTVRVEEKRFIIQGALAGHNNGQAGCSFSYSPPGPLMYYIQDEILHTSAPEASGLNFLRRLW